MLGAELAGKNLKTVELVNNKQKDPVLNLNAAFFGTPIDTAKPTPSDPYEEIFKKQKDFNAASSEQGNYAKGLVYHTDMNHPLSFHHQTLNNNTNGHTVQFPHL